jgi:DNA-binding NarL/FixJ family response regulator
MRSFKILVVEDFEAFRRFIVSALRRRAEYQVIGQAPDGLEAVQLAEQLQPDLILLDVYLPKMNGIEAAKRIREVAPLAKILFLSLESSSEVARMALRVGAMGYVLKARAQSDLLPAIEAILSGGRFVSSGIEDYQYVENTTARAAHNHEVLFYSDDAIFIETFTDFVAAALKMKCPAIVMATKAHRENLIQSLKSEGVDTDAAILQGTYISLDAAYVLSRTMVNGWPDRVRFLDGMRKFIQLAFKAAKAERPRIAICGEAVTLLWAEGKSDAAVLLEKAGNELSDAYEVDILCAYPIDVRQEQATFKSICAEHSTVSLL